MSTDYQPTATGPSAPAGHAWDAVSEYDANFAAWKAADDLNLTVWATDGAAGPWWWRYIPPVSVCFTKCSIKADTSNLDRLPKDFTVQGWDGDQWVTLLTVSNEPVWSSGEKRFFEFLDNSTSYSQYRIHITVIHGSSYVSVAEAEWFIAEEVGERSSMVVMI